jgi:hypothetical protein
MTNLWNDMKTYAMLANIWVNKRTGSITQDQTNLISLILWGILAWIMTR